MVWHALDPSASQQVLRGLLGQMLFSGDDALKRTEVLSGGEAAANHFLPPDAGQLRSWFWTSRPTISIWNPSTPNIALQQYPGTLTSGDDDDDVIDEVATRIWSIEHDRITDFKGTYAQFLSQETQLV